MYNSSTIVGVDNQFFKEETISLEDELGFDFSDDLSIQSDVIFGSDSSSSSSSLVVEERDENYKVAKASKRKQRGSKFMRKKAAPYPPKLALRPKVTATGVRTLTPNMSRRTRDTMLYAFPSFDRCDSLLFFPSTMARHMNSGNMDGISQLMRAHLDKYCTFDSYSGKELTQPNLTVECMVQKMEVLEQLQPDRIVCFRHVQVDGNIIKAVGYMKYTNVRAITEAVARRNRNTYYSACFHDSWEQHLRKKLLKENHSPEDRKNYLALVDKGCDLLVYSRMDITLTIDDRTKKIKHFLCTVSTTSIEEAKYVTVKEEDV